MKTIECDVCIVGSGIAGALIAEKLAEKYQRIVVLERGRRVDLGESARRRSQGQLPFPTSKLSMNHFVNTGRHAEPYQSENNVGGSTLRWWAHAPRFFPNDFRQKELYGVGENWPITYDDIEPYYAAAEAEMQIAGDSGETLWPRSKAYPQPAHAFSPVESALAKAWAPFGVTMRSMPLGRRSQTVGKLPACCGTAVCSIVCPVDGKYTALNTHVPRAEATGRVAIETGLRANTLQLKGRKITGVQCQDEQGDEVLVESKLTILAANAIENSRILLNTKLRSAAFRQCAQTGLNFMDHPNLEIRGLVPKRLGRGYGPTPSNSGSFDFCDGPFRSERAAGILEVSNLSLAPREYSDLAVAALREGLAGDAVRDRIRAETQGRFEMGFQMELLPSESNRITLSATRKDPFGWPLLEIHFDGWTDHVNRGALHIQELARRVVAKLGGEVAFSQRYESRHLMGTTRMGTSPDTSVVDPTLRHHHYDNLYLLGSGAFPTSGTANPTLLIAALTLRCADHLLGKS